MKPRTLFTWYKDVISDYHKDRQEGNFASHKVVEINDTTGEVVKEKVVHILNPYHIGHSMCIDEKMINGHYCTILSNQETGKITMLIDSASLIFSLFLSFVSRQKKEKDIKNKLLTYT